ncbi:sugar phosphate isomerase/epimerase family protein [Mesorhizobium sp. RMAD-H1]|uniref:sugar phosphate isomerase/epimerase family protein n=1 Tax=Mesorhizobium sp. RMAD-H1 TaxID=2587065 RepID=UPI001621C132|nr:sugar phosphate isomerase/epimerase family protein [Mesorhizobium sp. RMAD-H1]MBB2973205.1 sugar phosphate isomerase/epimerase [Mesorhizobium sp. RMAD-H1]
MARAKNKLIFHSMVSKPNSLAIDLEIARSLDFDGLETSGAKIAAFLAAGHTEEALRERLDGLFLPGIGFLTDLERQCDGRREMLREAEHLCALAAAAGAKGIEAITGPLDIRVFEPGAISRYPGLYRGLIDLPEDEQSERTAANLKAVADIAADHGLLVYLEALSWTPLNTMDAQLRILDLCNRDNVRVVVDFWHSYTSGDTPERIAHLDKDLIYGVHLCDSLPYSGGIPNEAILRDVPTGRGVLDLSSWVDAVKSTGYTGWWSCELFCNRQHQDNSFAVARDLKILMERLIPE